MQIKQFRLKFTLLAALLLVACSDQGKEGTTQESSAATSTGDTAAEMSGVMVSDPISRPTPPLTTVGVAYLSITNHGMNLDRLLSASSPAAARVELHVNSMAGTMTLMRPVEALELPPHQTVILDPGGMHFMLMDLVAPLVAGKHFPLTLGFETAGEITVDVVVQEDSGMSNDTHQHDHH